MSVLSYSGGWTGSATQLNAARSYGITRQGNTISNYVIEDITVVIWLSCNSYGKTYTVTVQTQNASATRDDIRFSADTASGDYFTFHLSPGSGFDPNNLSTITVSCSDSYNGYLYIKRNDGIYKCEIQYENYGYCSAPNSVSAPSVTSAGNGVTVSWSGASGGTYNNIVGYTVCRAVDDPNGNYYDQATPSSSPWTDTNVSTGHTYYYKVKTRGQRSGYDSGWSGRTSGTKVNTIPGNPTLHGSGTIYNPRPRILMKLGTDADGGTLAIIAQGYTASRSSAAPQSNVILRRAEDLADGASETVTVTNKDNVGDSGSASTTVEYAEPVWTDPVVTAGETPIKAAHINEIRRCLDDICDYYGLEQTDWTDDPIVAEVTSSILWPSHVQEIRDTIDRIANYINTWDSASSSNRVIIPQYVGIIVPTAEALNQLREIIALL